MSLRLFQHLLPNGRAFRITVEKNLRKFFVALGDFNDSIKNFCDLVWLDIDPKTTRELDAWEKQFNIIGPSLTDQERRNRLDANWKALGGQSPKYIQDTLRNNGFDVYVHEWWVPGTNPPVARDPLHASSNVQDFLVNVVYEPSLYYVTLCGEPLAVSGEEPMQCDNSQGFVFNRQEVTPPAGSEFRPYYLYIGGENFGDIASVPAARRNEFEYLCKKICPGQQWLALILQFN